MSVVLESSRQALSIGGTYSCIRSTILLTGSTINSRGSFVIYIFMNIMGDNLLGLFESEGGTIEKRGKTMINRRPTQYIPHNTTIRDGDGPNESPALCLQSNIILCASIYLARALPNANA